MSDLFNGNCLFCGLSYIRKLFIFFLDPSIAGLMLGMEIGRAVIDP